MACLGGTHCAQYPNYIGLREYEIISKVHKTNLICTSNATLHENYHPQCTIGTTFVICIIYATCTLSAT
jgi:hypothetical protein